MKNHVKALACAALFGASGYAAAVNIGGIEIGNGPVFGVASLYENLITGPGQTLSGFGEVSQINGAPITSLCSNCELTYRFAGFQVTSLTPTSVSFNGGYINFYVGTGAANDFNPFTSASSAADVAAATNGTLWLTLSGHPIDAAGNTFAGSGNNIGSATNVAGNGAGLFDVDMTGTKFGNTAGPGAVANSWFDSNTIAASFGGPADVQIGASFSNVLLPHPSECSGASPSGGACVAGSVDFRVVPIPEPQTYALMLAGLAAVGFIARRRRGSH